MEHRSQEMLATVLDIQWYGPVPIATVATAAGVVSRVHLLGREFVARYGIAAGSRLTVQGPCVLSVEGTPGSAGAATPRPDDDDVFDRWFSFRRLVQPELGARLTRLLFLSGVHTLSDLREQAHTLPGLKGIGPKSMERIRRLL